MKGGRIRGARSENFVAQVENTRGGGGEKEIFIPAYKQPRKHISARGLEEAKSYTNLHPEEVRKRNKLQTKRSELKATKEPKEGKEEKVKAVKSMFEMGRNKEKASRWARAKDFLIRKSGKGKEMVGERHGEEEVDDVERSGIELAL